MTKEQWLVYLWSIYPNGGFSVFYWILFVLSSVGLPFVYLFANDVDNEKLKQIVKKLFLIPLVSIVLIFISNFIPKREYFAYIIAAPYVVESGKSIVETLNDPNSKLSKLNQIMDKGLDKVLNELENKKDKENE